MNMEAARSSRRDEINRNFERTLTLLRSTKPEATELMLNMLNDSITKKYGDTKQLVDIKKFSKLNSNDRFGSGTKISMKKPKSRNIKSEANIELINHSSKQNIKKICDKTNDQDNELNEGAEMPKNGKKEIKKVNKKKKRTNLCLNNCFNEKNKKCKTNFIENVITAGKCDDTMGNISEPMLKYRSIDCNTHNKNLTNDEKLTCEISNQHTGIANENHTNEILNLDNFQLKKEMEHSGLPHIIKRTNTPTKPISKARSHKKPALHELSSRQRLQAILKKGINVK